MKMRPGRSFLAIFVVNVAGASATMASATAREKAFTSSQSCRVAIGTTTCRPLPPVVLRNGVRPSFSMRSRSTLAPSASFFQGTSSAGSKSKIRRSG